MAYFNTSTNSTHNNSTKNSLAVRKTKVCRSQPMLCFCIWLNWHHFDGSGSGSVSISTKFKTKGSIPYFSSKFQYSVQSIENYDTYDDDKKIKQYKMALVCIEEKKNFSMCKTCKILVPIRISMMPIHITKNKYCIQLNKLVTCISLLINNDRPIFQCHVKEFP